jgi:hypothetical protein
MGEATGTGSSFGGLFKSSSPSGTGVRGVATSTSGLANAGTFQTFSTQGAGVIGQASATSGANYGGFFKTSSPSGIGASVSNSGGGVGLRTESSGVALDVIGGAHFYGTALFDASPAFGVTSSTLITGLNADLLDGLSSTAFGRLSSDQSWSGKNRFNGNTGFGGAASLSKRVLVTGDAEVSGDLKVGSLTMSATTRKYTVGALDFIGAQEDIDDMNNPMILNGFGSKTYYAPVHLPEGAKVVSVSAFLLDTNPTETVTVFLIRRTQDRGSAGGTMAQFTSTTANGATFSDTTIASPTIDNGGFVYFVRVDLPGGNHFMGFASVHIDYTVDKPLP